MNTDSPTKVMRRLEKEAHNQKQWELDNAHGYGWCPHFECPLLDAQRKGKDLSIFIIGFLRISGNIVPNFPPGSIFSKHQ